MGVPNRIQVRVQPPTSAVNTTLPVFVTNCGTRCAVAAERRRLLSIDISCPCGALFAANPPHAATAVDRRDRRTDARSFHRLCCACYAGGVSDHRLVAFKPQPALTELYTARIRCKTPECLILSVEYSLRQVKFNVLSSFSCATTLTLDARETGRRPTLSTTL